MQHVMKAAKPNDTANSLCFQILGVDIFLDSDLKSWLIEVNQSPSFMTDSPFDHSVKKNLVRDSLHILNLSHKRKQKMLQKEKADKANRLVGRQNAPVSKSSALKKQLKAKEHFEDNNLGDFQSLYPLRKGLDKTYDQLMNKYDHILAKAKEVFESKLPQKTTKPTMADSQKFPGAKKEEGGKTL